MYIHVYSFVSYIEPYDISWHIAISLLL